MVISYIQFVCSLTYTYILSYTMSRAGEYRYKCELNVGTICRLPYKCYRGDLTIIGRGKRVCVMECPDGYLVGLRVMVSENGQGGPLNGGVIVKVGLVIGISGVGVFM